MSNWKNTLRIEDGELMAEVEVYLFQKRSTVPVLFEGTEELTPEAEAAVEAMLQRLPTLNKVIMDSAFEHYKWIVKEFGRIYGNQVPIPVATDVSTLQPLYELQMIYLPCEPEPGRFGLGFNCDWEEEHGLGLQFRNWQIVEIGGDAEAFSFYD
ncbi:hypothetical protein H8B13_04685 [Hymenobacter sp. BT188]|uniref:DUF6985 domain-containing protein n=1 Tax=Hymenobacter sp. BT188 TaxID=2763504 RepID=UPI001651540B|nr:hypothetical protein [Hymenobacter sp. BT188]MBC6606108.1 hypothetical protein [Hymenobacter sp. BT188]